MWLGFTLVTAAVVLARASGDDYLHRLVSYAAVGYLVLVLLLYAVFLPDTFSEVWRRIKNTMRQ